MSDEASGRDASGRRFWVACVLLYVASFAVTHLPPGQIPGRVGLNDKLAHMVGFAALGIATAVTVQRSIRHRTVAMWFGVWAAMLGYAFMDEATQPWVGRSFEWLDVAADGLGAASGIGAVSLYLWRRSRRG